MINNEDLMGGDSPNLTKVSCDLVPEAGRAHPDAGEGGRADAASQSVSQPCSLAPTRTNSFVCPRPRVGSSAARIRAGSLDAQPLVRYFNIILLK